MEKESLLKRAARATLYGITFVVAYVITYVAVYALGSVVLFIRKRFAPAQASQPVLAPGAPAWGRRSAGVKAADFFANPANVQLAIARLR